MIEREEAELVRIMQLYGAEMHELKQKIKLHRSGLHSPGFLRRKGQKEFKAKNKETQISSNPKE